MQHKWTTRVDGAQRRGNSLPFAFSCGLILTLKITLNYKHCASGSRSLLRNRPISSLMAVWEITGLEKMHFEGPPHVYFHPHFDISNLHAGPFQKLHKEQLQVLPETHRGFREHGGWACNTCVSKCSVIQQEPNQNYYSFTYLIIQTEFGIISPHVIYLRIRPPEEKNNRKLL